MSNVSRLVEIYINLGLVRSTALILAVLTFHAMNRYISTKELAGLTGLSKSSLSIRLRELVSKGVVESRRWGKRRLYRLTREGLLKLLRNYIVSVSNRLEALADSLNDATLRNHLRQMGLNIKGFVSEV